MATAKKRRRSARPPGRVHWVSPFWVVALVFSGLMIYVVVKKVDHISELRVPGSGIAFRGSASESPPPPEEQRQRAQAIEAEVKQQIRSAAAPAPLPNAVDLTGMWTMADGTAAWSITVENGYLVFREQNTAAPGVVSAVGYGGFDGHTWTVSVRTIGGTAGTASLDLQDDGTLQGEASIDGYQFPLALRR
jgi:hypothetical protein